MAREVPSGDPPKVSEGLRRHDETHEGTIRLTYQVATYDSLLASESDSTHEVKVDSLDETRRNAEILPRDRWLDWVRIDLAFRYSRVRYGIDALGETLGRL